MRSIAEAATGEEVIRRLKKSLRVSWREGLAEVENTNELDEDFLKQVIEEIGYQVTKIIKPRGG